MRDRKEMISFSKHDLEQIAKTMAKLRIVGDLFIGHISEQGVQWKEDGGINVITTYQEGTLDDIPKSTFQELISSEGYKTKKRK